MPSLFYFFFLNTIILESFKIISIFSLAYFSVPNLATMIVVKLTHHTHLTKTQPKVHVGKCVINIVYLESVIVKEEDGLTARESFASKNKFYLKKTSSG